MHVLHRTGKRLRLEIRRKLRMERVWAQVGEGGCGRGINAL